MNEYYIYFCGLYILLTTLGLGTVFYACVMQKINNKFETEHWKDLTNSF